MPLLLWLVRRYPIDRQRWQHHLPILLLAAVPIAIAKEAIFVAVGNVFRPGLFDLTTILSEDLSYEVMAVWACSPPVTCSCLRETEHDNPARRSVASEILVPTRNGTGTRCARGDRVRRCTGNYARLVTPRGRYLIRETMARLETRLGSGSCACTAA